MNTSWPGPGHRSEGWRRPGRGRIRRWLGKSRNSHSHGPLDTELYAKDGEMYDRLMRAKEAKERSH